MYRYFSSLSCLIRLPMGVRMTARLSVSYIFSIVSSSTRVFLLFKCCFIVEQNVSTFSITWRIHTPNDWFCWIIRVSTYLNYTAVYGWSCLPVGLSLRLVRIKSIPADTFICMQEAGCCDIAAYTLSIPLTAVIHRDDGCCVPRCGLDDAQLRLMPAWNSVAVFMLVFMRINHDRTDARSDAGVPVQATCLLCTRPLTVIEHGPI